LGLFDFFKKSEPSNQNKLEEQIEKTPDNGLAENWIKYAHPSKQGLYPHEILALYYATSWYTDENDPDMFQGFWWHRYGVKNVPTIFKSLFERGFLQVENLQCAIEKETVTTLKTILTNYNLKTSGKKTELVQRLMENISEEELNTRFPRRKYQRTTLGQEELDAEEYVTFIHNQSIEDLNIWTLNYLVYSEPRIPYRDIIWKYLNERSVRYAMEGQYGLYRNCRYTMAGFTLREGKTKSALGMLVEVIFYDLAAHPKEEILTDLIDDIVYCKKKLGYSDEEFQAVLLELTNGLSVPRQKFTSAKGVEKILKEVKEFEKNNTENDDDILPNPAAEVVLEALKQDLLAFLAARQPMPQKDFVAAWRETNPYSRIGDTHGVSHFLEPVFRSLVDEGRIRREKSGRSLNLFVNQ